MVGKDDPLVAEHRRWGMRASGAAAHRLARPTEHGILLEQGSNSALAGGLPITGPQGSLRDVDGAKLNRTLKGTVGLLISSNRLLIFGTTEDPCT